jgi:hypothetical protein
MRNCYVSYRGFRLRAFGAAATTLLALVTASRVSARPITFGQIDNFEDGTVMNWKEGAVSPNPPTSALGGPGGAADHYLRDTSNGNFGAGSKMIFFNVDQWVGNYNSAGVTRMSGMMANFGATTLHMRIGIQGGNFGTIFGSTNPINLAPGSGWQPFTFNLTTAGMTLVGGSDSLSDVLANVTQVRILSAESGPAFNGDVLVGTIGVDNLRALRLPGDANFDGSVNLTDFNALAGNFGLGAGGTWQQGDFNFDGAVNLLDFNLLASNFGLSGAANGPSPQDWGALAAAVPEPAALGLPILAAAALARHRKR